MFTPYYTSRLQLKPLDSSNADIVLAFYLNNKDFLRQWEPYRTDDFFTKQFHITILENERINILNGSLIKFWIFEIENPNKIIGSIAFSNIVRGPFLSCFLGYKLDKNAIKNGYMNEALTKSIEIIFDEVHLHRIEANIIPRNIDSLNVVKKLGFINEGISRKYLKINNIWEDHIHMVLLNDKV
ncbi:GNAT family N-acetyltransferase [Helicovermis profundi]|uniref:GNAT family protein n=1 Tax=Helicovermis profundi TaxID=3065157 RepID=A0AAU9EFF6_9FIRM|nr:GNAT family protein [Clostridia bacterium S502]